MTSCNLHHLLTGPVSKYSHSLELGLPKSFGRFSPQKLVFLSVASIQPAALELQCSSLPLGGTFLQRNRSSIDGGESYRCLS